MSAILASSNALPPARSDAPGATASLPKTGSECHAPGCALSSIELLKGQKTVAITHNGLIYRLQATRLGKLILTK